MKSAFLKLVLCIFFLSAVNSVFIPTAFAAYPIIINHNQERIETKLEEANLIRSIDTSPNPDNKKETKTHRSGIFGLLSFFCSILLLLYPETFIIVSILALTFGIMGVQKERRPKFLAIIGLLITIFSLVTVIML